MAYVGFTAYVVSIVRDKMRDEEKNQMKKEVAEIGSVAMSTGRLVFLLAELDFLLLAPSLRFVAQWRLGDMLVCPNA